LDCFFFFLTDFGLTKPKDESESLGTHQIGTPLWMGPEMFDPDKPTSAAVDIYSFGMVLFELLTRDIPWRGYTAIQVARAVLDKGQRPHIPTTEECPSLKGCPEGYIRLMQDCWGQEPSERPKISDVLARLEKMEENDEKGESFSSPHGLEHSTADNTGITESMLILSRTSAVWSGPNKDNSHAILNSSLQTGPSPSSFAEQRLERERKLDEERKALEEREKEAKAEALKCEQMAIQTQMSLEKQARQRELDEIKAALEAVKLSQKKFEEERLAQEERNKEEQKRLETERKKKKNKTKRRTLRN